MCSILLGCLIFWKIFKTEHCGTVRRSLGQELRNFYSNSSVTLSQINSFFGKFYFSSLSPHDFICNMRWLDWMTSKVLSNSLGICVLAWQNLLAFFGNKSSKNDYSAWGEKQCPQFSFITFGWCERITVLLCFCLIPTIIRI